MTTNDAATDDSYRTLTRWSLLASGLIATLSLGALVWIQTHERPAKHALTLDPPITIHELEISDKSLRWHEELANRFASGQIDQETASKEYRKHQEQFAKDHGMEYSRLNQILEHLATIQTRKQKAAEEEGRSRQWWGWLLVGVNAPVFLLIGRIVYGGWAGFFSYRWDYYYYRIFPYPHFVDDDTDDVNAPPGVRQYMGPILGFIFTMWCASLVIAEMLLWQQWTKG
ncbi:MAG: hypothetical protein K8T91_04665 [Planctomycetes bacterium]|nr:hypothetical protein [Planctomycetota bacterium]